MIEIPKGLDKVIRANDHGPLKSIVYMYRNKWDPATAQYEVEATPTNITKWLTKAANLILQLDLSEINRYDASNITLTFANTKNEFAEDVEGSLFPEGYLLYGSKFEYYVGASDDLKILMYTGTIAEEPTYRTESYEVDIRVVSQLELFKKNECSAFANHVTGEKLTGTYPNYTTVNIGVGNVLKLYAGTPTVIQEELILGVDYTLSGLNEMLSPAAIEIINPNLNGKTFYADYYYWKTNLKIHEIVHGLLDIMKIPQDKRYVEEVIFNTSVKNQFVGTSQAVGLGYYKEGDNDYKFNWFQIMNNDWANYVAPSDVVANRKNIVPTNFEINFSFKHTRTNAAAFGGYGFNGAYAIGDTPHASQMVVNGLYVVFLSNTNINGITSMYMQIREVTNGSYSVRYTSSTISGITYAQSAIKIRKINSVISVYVNNALVTTFTKTTSFNLDAMYSYNRFRTECLNYNITPLDSEGNSLISPISVPTLLSPIIDKGNNSDVWGSILATWTARALHIL
ncbi:hypothetical protein Dip510_001597 [Elusimicrobium posterum]|uniref:hypothetical protein n=1 Tax=Elusimicrobium posterum TaxID=3116653 RepID=UPI003C78E836